MTWDLGSYWSISLWQIVSRLLGSEEKHICRVACLFL